jgi:hypothetical protein
VEADGDRSGDECGNQLVSQRDSKTAGWGSYLEHQWPSLVEDQDRYSEVKQSMREPSVIVPEQRQWEGFGAGPLYWRSTKPSKAGIQVAVRTCENPRT